MIGGLLWKLSTYDHWVEIGLYDESNAVNWSSTSFTLHALSNYEHSPVYLLYYKILRLFISDNLLLYTTGGYAIKVFCFCTVIGSLLMLSRSSAFTLMMGGCLLLSSLLLTWPWVTLWAVSLAMIGIVAVLPLGSISAKLGAFSFVSLVLTFCRPEWVLTFYLVLVLWVVAFGVEAVQLRRGGQTLVMAQWEGLAGILFTTISVTLIGFPILSGGERAFVAFGQHFAIRAAAEMGSSTCDPSLLWKEFVNQAFPGANSVTEAWRINPARLRHHVSGNIKDTLLALATPFREAASALFHRQRLIGILLCVGIPALVVAEIFPHVTIAPASGVASETGRPQNLAGDLLVIFLLLVPICIGVSVVYPRGHYILMLFILVAAAQARIIAAYRRPDPRIGMAVLAAALLLSVLVGRLPLSDQQTLHIIQALRHLPQPPQVMLELDGGWCIYVKPQCRTIYGWEVPADQDAGAYLTERRVDAVMLSDLFRECPPLVGRPSWMALAAHPEQFGFTPIQLAGRHTLLLRNPGG